MKSFILKLILLSAIFFLLPVIVLAVTNSTNINVQVTYCNHNSICESNENSSGCPSDCLACNNNNVCDAWENNSNCPLDCPVCNRNSICEAGENTSNCLSDCPICNNNNVCDAGENNSNCSNDCPVIIIPPITGGGGGLPNFDHTPPQILNLGLVELDSTSALINWQTNELAVCYLYYGENQDYALGDIAEISFGLSHESWIRGLEAKTKYHYQISCYDLQRNYSKSTDQIFSTLAKNKPLQKFDYVTSSKNIIIFRTSTTPQPINKGKSTTTTCTDAQQCVSTTTNPAGFISTTPTTYINNTSSWTENNGGIIMTTNTSPINSVNKTDLTKNQKQNNNLKLFSGLFAFLFLILLLLKKILKKKIKNDELK